MHNTLENVRLYSKKDGADKEYHLRLVQTDDGFLVEYSNGKRGSNLQHGLRTKTPVTEEVARTEYKRVLASKLKDGYTKDESGEAFSGTDKAGRKTAFTPQLLVAIDDDQAQAILYHGEHVAQVKHDGERRYIKLENGEVTAANRDGLQVPVKAEIEAAVLSLQRYGVNHVELDGEDMRSHFVFFDVLSLNGANLREMGFTDRYTAASLILKSAFEAAGHNTLIVCSEILSGSNGKLQWSDIQALRARGEEGVCLKERNAPYEAGRPKTQYKLKFWESATVRVRSNHPTKRSVGMEVLNSVGDWIGVGNVTIPVNVKDIPAVGSLIEVRYLYAFEGGSLFEPTFDKMRGDLHEASAVASQLKYKRAALAA